MPAAGPATSAPPSGPSARQRFGDRTYAVATGSTTLPPRLSRYSEYYRDLDEEQADRALASMRSRLEDFRLRLDLDHILPWIKGPDVLDFPIGTGRIYPNLIGRFNVYGYDIAPLYIERAKSLHRDIADHFQLSELERPVQSRSFDTVVTMRTLPRIGETDAAVRGVASILKPSGRWIFNYPSYEKDFESLPRMLSGSGLRLVNIESYDLHAGRDGSRLWVALYSRYRTIIERGHIPYFAFKAIDTALAKRGTKLFVVEKQ